MGQRTVPLRPLLGSIGVLARYRVSRLSAVFITHI